VPEAEATESNFLSLVGAIVLAGGRSSRLDEFPKPLLRGGGTTLLGLTLRALVDAGVPKERIVVVGPPNVLTGSGFRDLTVVREDPPFSGPVAGIAAGFEALAADVALSGMEVGRGGQEGHTGHLEFVLALACDMPNLGPGVRALLGTAAAVDPASTPAEAWVGVSRASAPGEEDRVENLMSLHRASALADALRGLDPKGMSVRALLSRLAVAHVDLPTGAAADVDTWEDAERLGLHSPQDNQPQERQPGSSSPGDRSPREKQPGSSSPGDRSPREKQG
jgi:molybdopterin-guanine dinucleotide biosynthesis protein A